MTEDFRLKVAQGLVKGYTSVNKFGRAPNGIQTTATDVWDRADATPTQQIWTAPTVARRHDIVSTSTSDAAAGVGARTIQIYGLKTWASEEDSEIITMNGDTAVQSSNSYVIIHRMKVLTKGATNVNVGTITATAATDGTVTAQINAGEGQTQMSIYGVPNTQSLYIGRFYANLNKSIANASVLVKLKVNHEPQTELLNFRTVHTFAIGRDGTSAFSIPYWVPKVIDGPAIVKIQCIASAADEDVSAGFDGILTKTAYQSKVNRTKE